MNGNGWGRLLVAGQVVCLLVGFGMLTCIRYSVIDWRPGLMILGGAVLAMAVIGFIALVSVYAGLRTARGSRMRQPLTAAALSVVPVGIVLLVGIKSRDVPPIHDITTDTSRPPVFRVLAERRRPSENSLAYGGNELAKIQEQAYPGIKPLFFAQSPEKVYTLALDAALQMGWEVAASDGGEGRIEAVATTVFFHFKDDVVIRVSPVDGEGARVDVRSASRVGVSDFGTNAKRILAFRTLLESSLR